MKNRLSRKKARAMIVLVAVGLPVTLFGYMAQDDIMILIGFAAIFLSLCFSQRCPGCGRWPRHCWPQWSERGKFYCSLCGQRLAYDDEL